MGVKHKAIKKRGDILYAEEWNQEHDNDMRGEPLKNLGAPVDPDDAVRKRDLETLKLTRDRIIDFWEEPFWPNIPDKPSQFPPEPHASSHGLGGEDKLSLDASQIVSGILDVARIPDLTRSKITDFFDSPFWDNIPDKPSTFPSDEELALCLPFNEGYGSVVHDVSGNGNNGTIYGATWVRGRLGWALSFGGEDDYVEVPSTSDFHPNALTISVWVYPKSVPNLRGIVDKGGWHPVDYNGEWSVSWTSANRFEVHFYTADLNQVFLRSPGYDPEKWYHVVVTWNGSVLKLYVNGELVDSADLPSLNSLDYNINIGRTQRYTRYFHGIIDEVRIYSRALTEEEIKALYYSSQSVRREHVTSVMKVLDSDIIPTIDNAYDIGSSSLRWKNGYFAGTVYSGDFEFKNKWRITEYDEKENMIEGLRILNSKGEEIFKITEDGLWFKGNKIA
ncbi:MAG: LamG domain-containing protein [Candidatus Thorarchaeota archaeon]